MFKVISLPAHQIRWEIVPNLIGPSVVQDLVEGHDTLSTTECNA
jgi:hypothetical protein